MNLPVITVCGLCTFCGKESGDVYSCEHHQGAFVGAVDPTTPPPMRCPLRRPFAPTDEIEKLFRRWADTVRKADAASRAFDTSGRTSGDYVAWRVAEIHEEDALEALRLALTSEGQ